MIPLDFLLRLDDDRLVDAIRRAERLTGAEIRVYISDSKITDPVAAARDQFVRMGMTQTQGRNGVLIFVAPRSRNFALIGDQQIHARCAPTFWTDVAAAMEAEFRNERVTEAIVLGIAKVAQLLATHFPRSADDINELPDAIERGA